MDPLVVGVVIGAEDVEVLRATPEFGAKSAADHVPRLKLRLPVSFSSGRVFGVVRIGSNVDDRLAVADAGGGIHLAYGLDCGDRCAHELGLKLRAAPLG